MALGAAVELHLQHRQVGANRLPWATTYQVVTNTEPDLSYSEAQLLLEDIANAENLFYYSNISITGGSARAFIAKTTVPDPDPPPYDPSQHTSVSFLKIGPRNASSDELFYDQVLDIMRTPEYGNIGHIELRGVLSEADVDQSLSFRRLTSGALSMFSGLVTDFATALATIAASHDVTFRMIGQPLLSTSWAIQPNGKPKATRTYGAATFREVVAWTLGQIRTDKGHNRYFDHNV